jgi:hypothetical protein
MSAYSRQDLEDAFACTAERVGLLVPPEIVRQNVLDHLGGNCPCDRNRCRHCKQRPRNTVPNHAPKCPMALKSV